MITLKKIGFVALLLIFVACNSENSATFEAIDTDKNSNGTSQGFSDGDNKEVNRKSCSAKIHLEVKGELDGTFIAEIITYSELIPLDTFQLDENGKGSISVDLDGIELIRITDITKRGHMLVPVNKCEVVSLVAQSSDLEGTYQAKGSDELDALSEFLVLDRTYRSFSDSLKRALWNLKKNNAHHAVQQEFDDLYKTRTMAFEDNIKAFIDKDSTKYVNYLAIQSLPIKRFRPYHEKVSKAMIKRYPNSVNLKYFLQEVNKYVAQSTGGTAPSFVLPNRNNEPVALASFKGKYVLLDFWATWCRPCIEEIPNLKATYDQFGGDKFEVVSICVDKESSKAMWNRILDKFGANWPQLYDSTGEVSSKYNIRYFPSIFLINPEGEIIAKNIRGKQIPTTVKKVLESK